MTHTGAPVNRTVLIVGPQPPPLGGGTVNVQVLLEELAKYPNLHVQVVNTSPSETSRRNSLLRADDLGRALRIIREYCTRLGKADAVLIIAAPTSVFFLGLPMLLLAKASRVPYYVKPLGADLHLWLHARSRAVRAILVKGLAGASGVFAQTQELRSELCTLGLHNVTYMPGYRPAAEAEHSRPGPHKGFRLIFLSQIYREKGAFLLLEVLRILLAEGDTDLSCDFYGPILEEDRQDFLQGLQQVPCARYQGAAEIGTATQLMTQYDALVFPSFRPAEGHPGVIIEAMQAGIPVISTRLGSIPELIAEGENGLLIPAGDAQALARAIRQLAADPALREKMGNSNRLASEEFRSDRVIRQMMMTIFPGMLSSQGT